MTPIRELFTGLPFVVTKRLNGREGFFTAGRMFGLLSDHAVLLRLPRVEGESLVDDQVPQALAPAIPAPLVWVELAIRSVELEDLRFRVTKAHEAVRALSRQVRRRRQAMIQRRSRSTA